MRTCHLILASLLLLELLLSLHAEAFIKISVPTAFAVITAAVKSKAILLKAYLGLKSLGYLRSHRRPPRPPYTYPHVIGGPGGGYYSQHPRYKRSVTPEKSYTNFNPDDLMAAWRELENASRRPLIFDEASCAKASKSDRKQLPLWGKLLQSEYVSRLSNREYSAIVSLLVGSMTGDPNACQFTKIITANLIKTAKPAQIVTINSGKKKNTR